MMSFWAYVHYMVPGTCKVAFTRTFMPNQNEPFIRRNDALTGDSTKNLRPLYGHGRGLLRFGQLDLGGITRLNNGRRTCAQHLFEKCRF